MLVPLVFEFFFVAILAPTLLKANAETKRLNDARTIIDYWSNVMQVYMRCLDSITAEENERSRYISQFDGGLVDLQLLRSRVGTTPTSHEMEKGIEDIMSMLDTSISTLRRVRNSLIAGARSQDKSASIDRLQALNLLFQLQAVSKETFNQFEYLANLEKGRMELDSRLILLILCGWLLSVLVAIAGAFIFSKTFAQRLATLEASALTLRSNTATAPTSLDGDDELNEIDLAIRFARQTLSELHAKETALLHDQADVICALNSDLKFTKISQAASRAWRIKPANFVGHVVSELIDIDSSIVQQIKALGETERPLQIECKLVDGANDKRVTRWSITWSEHAKSYFCVVRDITERREAEKLRQRFVSMAGHDLRTPLQAARGSLGLLAEGVRGNLPSHLQKMLKQAEHNLEQLSDLINIIIDFEKLESGKVSAHFGCVNAFDICATACDSIESLLKKHSLAVDRPDCDAALLADEARLQQAIIALLTNAIAQSPPDRHLYLKIEEQQDFALLEIGRHDYAQVSKAADTWEDNEVADTIQEVKPANSRTELLLSIARLIIQAHAGSLIAHKDDPERRLFSVYIPLFVIPGPENES